MGETELVLTNKIPFLSKNCLFSAEQSCFHKLYQQGPISSFIVSYQLICCCFIKFIVRTVIRAKKLPVDNKIRACQRNISPGCCIANRKTLWWNILFSWETFAINIKFCASINLLFFYELLIGRRPTFLESIYFPL